MISPNSRFEANQAEVAHKVFDGEVILINLSGGTYYSMDKTGCVIWELIEKGHSCEEISESLIARYDISAEIVKRDVTSLIEQLVKENLILSADQRKPDKTAQAISAANTKLSYEEPKLHIYRDMADLLALDPPMPKLYNTPWQDPRPSN